MKFLGFGLGLRAPHYSTVTNDPVRVDWFEALTENYFGLESHFGGPALPKLLKVRERFPIVLHGVSLSVAGSDPLDKNYLDRLQRLVKEVEPEWISDHLCWTSHGGHNSHDLLPLPRTQSMLKHLASRIAEVQERIQRPILFENISSYIEFSSNEMPEGEFLAELSRRTGCQLLLDLNNIYVNSRNHNISSSDFLRAIPKDAVGQIHLAGAVDKGTHLLDTHDREIRTEVWDLYRASLDRFGPVSTMVEWDAAIPEFNVLEEEALKAKAIFLDWKGSSRGLESVTISP